MTDAQNPPAFPSGVQQDGYNPGNQPFHTGLSARAYFAAHAPITLKDAFEHIQSAGETPSYAAALRILAQMRVAYADAMLEAGAV